MSTFFSSDDSTAFATHTHNTMEEMALNVLAQELGENIPETDDAWPTSLYHDLTEATTIEGYLEKSGEYLDGRWARMPASPKLKSELCKSLCDLISSVLQHFRVSRSEATRQAVDIHTTPFKPADAGSTGMFASPDVVVKASGPSFSPPKGASIGFSNVSACFITKLDAEIDNVLDDLAQTTAFARQMFFHQPNRFFVRSLVVTEHHARLFHFDRSGAQYSPLIHIHDDADQFVRLILGLCTTNETTLGLDDSVQWTTGSSGSKISGTLKTVGPDDTVVTYDLVMNELPFVRTGIRGRGTICWPVKNASGDRFVVKDHWIAGSGAPEYELLAEAKGLPGLCQMVSYEDNRAQTKDLRGNTKAFGNDTSFNRRAIRIVMKAYGPSIEKFSCVEEVLGALRDTIAAHRVLLSRDIIHRDISPNNILRGPPGAEKGDRGILIDLDIAFKCHQMITESRADFKIGTRMFQSLMVLRTWEMERKDISAQDYLDDLEGFFWVFSYLLFAYKANGKRAPESSMREHVLSWHQIPSIAYALKHTFIYSRRVAMDAEKDMDEGWRHACMDLFLEFRDYMGKLAMEKEDLLRKQRGEPEVVGVLPNKFSSLLEKADEHYGHVLGLFDVALKKAKQVQKTDLCREKGTAAPHPSSTFVDTPSSASVTAKNTPTAPSQTELPSSPSDQPTLTTPCDTPRLMPLTQHIPSRSPKRRSEAAELEEPPADVKRACPPNRRSLRAVVDPTLHALNSVYQYCIQWL
ncbi:hypothetical protein H1R20_g10292, partial [Candolleomyces eurysporus]